MYDVKRFLEDEGYHSIRMLENGVWIGIFDFLFTHGLCVGLTQTGYAYRYCYEHLDDAKHDAANWDGNGHPPGNWIKLKNHPQLGDLLNEEYLKNETTKNY